MSSVITPRLSSAPSSSGPKSSPTGPTTRTSVKKLAASEKWTAEPPSIRSRSPNGVRTESKAIDPTAVSDISLRCEGYSDRGVRRARAAQAGRGSRPRGVRRHGGRGRRAVRDELGGHTRYPERLPGGAGAAVDPGSRDRRHHRGWPQGGGADEQRRLRPEGGGPRGLPGAAARRGVGRAGGG